MDLQKTQRSNTQTFKHSNKCVYVFMCLCVYVFLFSVFSFAPAAQAAALLPEIVTKSAGEAAGYAKTTTETTLAETLGNIVNAILSLMGVFFMALMVYAGYLWMTARGEEPQIEKAQNIIRGAIIGLIILLASYSITNFVVPKILEKTTGQRGAGTTTAPPGEGPVGGGGIGGASKICAWKGAGWLSVDNNEQADKRACVTWCGVMSSNNNATLECCTFDGEKQCGPCNPEQTSC